MGRNKNKNKPRRKPRKRSEVFPTSSSGSGSKRGMTYDPIMEVSLHLDETDRLVNNSSEEDVVNNIRAFDHKTGGSETCHNNTDDDDDADIDDETFATKLLNRETCV